MRIARIIWIIIGIAAVLLFLFLIFEEPLPPLDIVEIWEY